MVFRHIRGMQLGEYGNLLDDVFDFVLGIFNIDHFDGYRLPCPLIDPVAIS